MQEWGPWERAENLDGWVRSRWDTWLERKLAWWYNNGPIGTVIRKLYYWLHDIARRPNGNRQWAHWANKYLPSTYQGGTVWEWPWYPRTCTFCGGVHPADALRLVQEGWEYHGTDKGYKAYLEPPGWHAFQRAWLDHHTLKTPKPAKALQSPVPPVKIYVQHFSQRDIESFNTALKVQPALRDAKTFAE